MSRRLDVSIRSVEREGSAVRENYNTASDMKIRESMFHLIECASGATIHIPLGAIGFYLTRTRRVLEITTDKFVRFNHVTRLGESDLTTLNGHGIDIAPNGHLQVILWGGNTGFWVTNKSTSTGVAKIGVRLWYTTLT